MQEDVIRQLEEIQNDVRDLKRDLYGNPQIRQKGVFDRVESLEHRISELRSQYERERTEEGLLARMSSEVAELKMSYRETLIYLRGIGAAVGAIFLSIATAIVVGILRYWSG